MSFLEKLKDATIGFSGYARLAQDPRGGFGFVALLLAIVLAINGYINMVQLRRVAAEMSRQMATWPDFGVRNGQFYFEGPMPFKQTTPDGTQITVDTTGQTTPEALKGQRAILITRERYYIIQPGVNHREFSFARLQTDVTKHDLLEILAAGPQRVLPFAYLFIYLFQLAFKAIDAVILALVALFYGRMVGRQVRFELGFRLGLYAMSLPIIIQWIWPAFHTWTATGFTIWWSVASIYLLFGLRAYWASESPEGPPLR
mgnify:CR=1 FL=1